MPGLYEIAKKKVSDLLDNLRKEKEKVSTVSKPVSPVINDYIKNLYASMETSGDIKGDWLQLEKNTFNDLKKGKKIPLTIMFEGIAKRPSEYDIVAKAYIKDLKETFKLPDDETAALWSYRPGWYKKYGEKIENIPKTAIGSFGKTGKDVMRQRMNSLNNYLKNIGKEQRFDIGYLNPFQVKTASAAMMPYRTPELKPYRPETSIMPIRPTDEKALFEKRLELGMPQLSKELEYIIKPQPKAPPELKPFEPKKTFQQFIPTEEAIFEKRLELTTPKFVEDIIGKDKLKELEISKRRQEAVLGRAMPIALTISGLPLEAAVFEIYPAAKNAIVTALKKEKFNILEQQTLAGMLPKGTPLPLQIGAGVAETIADIAFMGSVINLSKTGMLKGAIKEVGVKLERAGYKYPAKTFRLEDIQKAARGTTLEKTASAWIKAQNFQPLPISPPPLPKDITPKIALPFFPSKPAVPSAPMAGGVTGRKVPEQITKWLEKGVTITQRQAPIRLTEPEPKIKDISGKTVDLVKGHEMTPYKLSNGKIWLHDFKDAVVESGQLQNLKNKNLVLGEKPFISPEEEQVEEVVKGGELKELPPFLKTPEGEATNIGSFSIYIKKVGGKYLGNVFSPYDNDAVLSETGNTPEEVKSNLVASINADKKLMADANISKTKFSQWQLPGGENYREVLIKAPTKLSGKQEIRQNSDGSYSIWEDGKIKLSYIGSKEAAETQLLNREKNIFKVPLFTSSHWDEPNVLAHMRVNDRTTPDGKKVYFIEEIQSDWKKTLREGKAPENKLLKNWQELTLKRAIKEAVDKGYDYISWTTGEQQAERYDLSKQISSVKFIKNKNGTVDITAYPIDDNGINTVKKTIPAEQLDTIVGKDLANKINSSKDTKGQFSGVDLKIGGEWAKSLYDRQIPNILKDLTKGEVGTVNLTIPLTKDQLLELSPEEAYFFRHNPEELPQPALKITPEIRARVLGQPMAGGITPPAVPPAEPPKPPEPLPEPKKRPPSAQKILGIPTPAKVTLPETAGLKLQLRKEAKGAAIGFKAGRREVIRNRGVLLKAEQEKYNLTDTEFKPLLHDRNFGVMTDKDFKEFLDKVRISAGKTYEKKQVRNQLISHIEEKELKVENLRKAMKLPSIKNMTIEQMQTFDKALEPFQEADIFLPVRQIEVIDRVKTFEGARTYREIKERLAKEMGIPVKELNTVKTSEFDRFLGDSPLSQRNAFYKIMLGKVIENDLDRTTEFLKIKSDTLKISRKVPTSFLIPQHRNIFNFIQASPEEKKNFSLSETELELANYMILELEKAREYLIAVEAMGVGKENYFTHIRRGILEALKEEPKTLAGIKNVIKEVLDKHRLTEQSFSVKDEKTGEILPFNTWFKFAMQRTGGIKPTQNVVETFLTYMKLFKRKQALDEAVPYIKIYTQALTPANLTKESQRIHGKLVEFVNTWLNTKRGKVSTFIGIQQGGKIDSVLQAIRTFTYMRDLALNIAVQFLTPLGEQVATYQLLGKRKYLLGKIRYNTKQGKAITRKYENFIGENPWTNLIEPAKSIGKRLEEGLFIMFADSRVRANKTFLLGSLSPEEFKSGIISSKRLADLRLELGRYRSLPGTSSIIGSSSIAKSYTQYRQWALPILQSNYENIKTISVKLFDKNTSSEAKKKAFFELYKMVELSAFIAIIYGFVVKPIREERSFRGRMLRKAYNELNTVLQATNPLNYFSLGRTADFVSKLAAALNSIIKLERYKEGKREGQLKGLPMLSRELTPVAVTQFTSKNADMSADTVERILKSLKKEQKWKTNTWQKPSQNKWKRNTWQTGH